MQEIKQFITTREAKIEYAKLIKHAKTRERIENPEIHHIRPRSHGGNDNSKNLVSLTAEEHYNAHVLLAYMFTGWRKDSMIRAWHFMAHIQSKVFVSSSEYSILKEEFRIIQSVNMSGSKNPMYGKNAYENKTPEEMLIMNKKKSDNTPWKNSKRPEHSLKMIGHNNPFYGCTHSTESRDKISKSAKDRPILVCERCNSEIKGKSNLLQHDRMCKKYFDEQTRLKNLELQNIKIYWCDSCNRGFEKINAITAHKSVCKGNQWYIINK